MNVPTPLDTRLYASAAGVMITLWKRLVEKKGLSYTASDSGS